MFLRNKSMFSIEQIEYIIENKKMKEGYKESEEDKNEILNAIIDFNIHMFFKKHVYKGIYYFINGSAELPMDSIKSLVDEWILLPLVLREVSCDTILKAFTEGIIEDLLPEALDSCLSKAPRSKTYLM